MSDKLNMEASKSKNTQNTEDDVTQQMNDAKNTVKNDDPSPSNDRDNGSPKPKATKSIKNDHKHYATYDKSKSNDTKTEAKKKLSDSTVVDYLKSEFVGLNAKDLKGQEAKDKLPKYTEIDMTGYSRKYIDKHTKAWIYSKGKRHRLFLKQPMIVQIMGSENLPESKVIMVYEPETRNHTVKGMFVIMMVLHFFTWFFSMALWTSPLQEDFMKYGHYICIIPFSIEILIIVLAACFQICRRACCIFCNTFWVMFFHCIGCASFANYFDIRVFFYAYLTLFFTDLVCVIVGCFNFNFTSKKLYAIELTSASFFLLGVIPLLNFFGKESYYYWGDDPSDGGNIVCYVLNFLFTFVLVIFSVAELHLLLAGEWVELGEDDFSFGGFLMYVSPIDFPIRMLRKFGAFNKCDSGGDDEEEE